MFSYEALIFISNRYTNSCTWIEHGLVFITFPMVISFKLTNTAAILPYFMKRVNTSSDKVHI